MRNGYCLELRLGKLQKKAPNALKSLDAELKSAPVFRLPNVPSGDPACLGRAEACQYFLQDDTSHREAYLAPDCVSSSKELPAHETLEDETEEQGDYGKTNQVGLVENVRAKAIVIG